MTESLSQNAAPIGDLAAVIAQGKHLPLVMARCFLSCADFRVWPAHSYPPLPPLSAVRGDSCRELQGNFRRSAQEFLPGSGRACARPDLSAGQDLTTAPAIERAASPTRPP